ncbi:MAG: sulfotransferase [Candidatus Velamenicoccus archaeovorus]
MTLPNFVMIGAAKAGTTALYWYLTEHPQVFMSPMKETNFFAYGLDERGDLLYGDPDLHTFPVRTLEEYAALFGGAGDAVAVGEISPIYLECPQAAARMHELVPHARILCILRHPVDRAYSDYQMYLRSRGRRLDPARDLTPEATWARPDSHWMQIGRYHDALARYVERFPRERIHVFLFDDLRRDARGFVQDVYRSLGVDPTFVPDLETPHNVGGMPKNRLVERLLMSKRLKTMVQPLVPRRAADLARRIRTRNLRRAPTLPSALRAELTARFRDDIERTAQLIGRDLGHWLVPEPPASP